MMRQSVLVKPSRLVHSMYDCIEKYTEENDNSIQYTPSKELDDILLVLCKTVT